MSCPIFVGREHELGRLLAAGEGAAAGRPSLVLVAGEAGAGKSRLIDELAARLRAGGVWVGVGGCVDFGQVGLPYAPVIELLRDFAAQLGSTWDELTGELPGQLGRLLAGGTTVDGDPVAAGISGLAQVQLFELVLGLMVRLGESAPVVVVVEDLHWADPSTRNLVAFLARNLRRCRVAVIATYRQDALDRGHPLRPLLAELTRAGVARVELGGLNRSHLRTLLAGILGMSPAGSLVDEILARSEGNPFYAEELLAAFQAGETGLPVSLREVILSRLEQLPEPSRRLLQTVAAAGQRAHVALLEQIVDLSEADLDDALAAALEAGVLVPVAPDRYRFRHALIQEVVSGDLLPGRRRRLHRRIAEILTEQPQLADGSGSSVTGELAYHWEAAGELQRSLEASMTAGRAAQALAAPVEAAAHYRRVLSLWQQAENPESLAGADHPTVLMAAAGTTCLAGDAGEAVTLARSAMAEVDAANDRAQGALICERLAQFTWLTDDIEGAMVLYERAGSLLASEPPSPAKARVLAARGVGLRVVNRWAEAKRQCEEAIAVARTVNDRAAEGHATNTLGTLLVEFGRWEEGIEYLRRALGIAEDLSEPEHLFRAYNNLSLMLFWAGRPLEAADVARSGLSTAARFGCMSLFGSALQANLVEALVFLGRLPEAFALLGDDVPAERGVARVYCLLARAHLTLAAGDVDGAENAVNAALADTTGGRYAQHTVWVLTTAAEVAVLGGKVGEARHLVDKARQVGASRRSSYVEGLEAAIVGIRIEVEAARRGDSPAPIGTRTAKLLSEAHELALVPVREGGRGLFPERAARLAVAEAEATTAMGMPDANAWAEAVHKLDNVGLVLEAARGRLLHAEALLTGRGSRHEAARLTAQARAVADSSGAKPLLAEADRLTVRARLDLASVRQAPLNAGPADRYGLTVRETEVLARLAAGRTNRQIAQDLFINEKTASVHVSNLLRKLSVATRIEAGAIGQHLGLG